MKKKPTQTDIAMEGAKAFREQSELALSMLFERAGINKDSELRTPVEIETLLSSKGYRILVQKSDELGAMADIFVLVRFGQPVYGYMVKMEPGVKKWIVNTYPLDEKLLKRIVRVDSDTLAALQMQGERYVN